MAGIIAKDIPLAELTLRKYEKPQGMQRRELVRKLCLSLGLLQPGDSRDAVIDVLLVLLESKDMIDSVKVRDLVIERRKQQNLPLQGVAQSNIRRQVRRLRELFLVQKIRNYYKITEDAKLLTLFEERIERYYMAALLERVKEYLKAVDLEFGREKAVGKEEKSSTTQVS
ncbi:hypothetical protein HZB02_01110 [Candidatus Woesearchaeota archaeon]|nr:hypothetical protein [Candidatus Woesearchaeota archaeon]